VAAIAEPWPHSATARRQTPAMRRDLSFIFSGGFYFQTAAGRQ
jgi:hypothetical protein